MTGSLASPKGRGNMGGRGLSWFWHAMHLGPMEHWAHGQTNGLTSLCAKSPFVCDYTHKQVTTVQQWYETMSLEYYRSPSNMSGQMGDTLRPYQSSPCVLMVYEFSLPANWYAVMVSDPLLSRTRRRKALICALQHSSARFVTRTLDSPSEHG